MKVAVIASLPLREELLAQGLQEGCELQWLDEPAPVEAADAYIDLQFEAVPERVAALKALQPALVLVNAVTLCAEELPEGFIRINGWPGFLKRKIAEVAGRDETQKDKTEALLNCFGKQMEWVADQPGMVAARVLCMIINEAYLAFEEGVSTRDEIDTAMLLGTGYPLGPFAWARQIGYDKVAGLLSRMALLKPGYQPAPLLLKDAGTA